MLGAYVLDLTANHYSFVLFIMNLTRLIVLVSLCYYIFVSKVCCL